MKQTSLKYTTQCCAINLKNRTKMELDYSTLLPGRTFAVKTLGSPDQLNLELDSVTVDCDPLLLILLNRLQLDSFRPTLASGATPPLCLG